MSSARTEAGDRIPFLDGLRAIAIGLVLFGHAGGTPHVAPLVKTIHRLGDWGDLGVRIFFVISGFLITTLLLAEIDRQRTIRLGRFYFRRTLRIFPAYYAFLAAVVALHAMGVVALGPGDIGHAVTYTTNYHATRSWSVGHTWSLAVEEQFYLLWPALLLLAGRRTALGLAAVLLAMGPVIRLGLWLYAPAARPLIGHSFFTVADAIAAGCLLAGARAWLHAWPPYRAVLASRLFAAVPLLMVAASMLYDRPRLNFVVGMTIMNVGSALCVDRCLTHGAGRVGALLRSRPLAFVGVLSYSLYLWQQLFFDPGVNAMRLPLLQSLALVSVAALASYFLIERPFLRLRERLEPALFPRAERASPTADAVSTTAASTT